MSTGLDLDAIAKALAETIGQVAGIKASYDHIPDRIPTVPAAYVGVADPVTYHRRFAIGAAESDITVTIVVNRPNEASSQRTIRRLQSMTPVDGEGAHPSIASAIAADPTLGGTCGTCVLVRSESPRLLEAAGTDYLGIDFVFRVHT